MTSETDIVNRAMRLLKANRVTSLDDGSKNANVAKDVFDSVREELLRGHTWNFATKLATLARLATAPAFQYDYAYALPDDWLRTIALYDNDAGLGTVDFIEAEVDGSGALLCSIENAYLKYVYKLSDPNRMPPDFQTALVYELAVQMPGISNLSADSWDKLTRDSDRKLRRAKSADALGQPPMRRPAGSWTSSRWGWPRNQWPT